MADFHYSTDPWHDELGRLYIYKCTKKVPWPYGLKQVDNTVFLAADNSFAIGRVKSTRGRAFWVLNTYDIGHNKDYGIPTPTLNVTSGPAALSARVPFSDLFTQSSSSISYNLSRDLSAGGNTKCFRGYDSAIVTPDGKWIVPNVWCVKGDGWERDDPSTLRKTTEDIVFSSYCGEYETLSYSIIEEQRFGEATDEDECIHWYQPYEHIIYGPPLQSDLDEANELSVQWYDNDKQRYRSSQQRVCERIRDSLDITAIQAGTYCGTKVIKLPVSALVRNFSGTVSGMHIQTQPARIGRGWIIYTADSGPFGNYNGFGIVNDTTYNIQRYLSGQLTVSAAFGYSKNSILANEMDRLYKTMFNIGAIQTIFYPSWGYTNTVIDCFLVNARIFITEFLDDFELYYDKTEKATSNKLLQKYELNTGCDLLTDFHACTLEENLLKLRTLNTIFSEIQYRKLDPFLITYKKKRVDVHINPRVNGWPTTKGTCIEDTNVAKLISSINNYKDTEFFTRYESERCFWWVSRDDDHKDRSKIITKHSGGWENADLFDNVVTNGVKLRDSNGYYKLGSIGTQSFAGSDIFEWYLDCNVSTAPNPPKGEFGFTVFDCNFINTKDISISSIPLDTHPGSVITFDVVFSMKSGKGVNETWSKEYRKTYEVPVGEGCTPKKLILDPPCKTYSFPTPNVKYEVRGRIEGLDNFIKLPVSENN